MLQSPARAAAASPPSRRTGVVIVSRRTMLGVALSGTVLLAWAGATTWYIACRDELAQRFFAQQTEMKFAYEDRIDDLSGRLRREMTQNLVERNGFEARVAALVARQADIEARQAWLTEASERVNPAPEPTERVAGERPSVLKLDELPRKLGLNAKPGPVPELRLRDASGEPSQSGKPKDRLSAIELSIDAVHRGEIGLATRLAETARTRLSRLRAAVDATGVDVNRRVPDGGVGGPLVPLPASRGGAFGLAAADLDLTLSELERVKAIAAKLPLGQPLAGELEQTSPFGYRLDPFTRTPALHTGTDFRIEYGGPVRATGAGRVTIAEMSGGYGNLVEIDHGGGIATRYGHLSAFLVAPGDRVEAGQIIGRAGSTGRSTGSHVHYETRINGEPVNPTRFLEAGRLAGTGRT